MRDILASVEKPFRYIGGEVGVRKKAWDDAAVRLCLAFPDTYEIGMSNIGLAILYNIVNDRSDMLAERVFTPWTDMEAELTKRGLPLFSLESKKPIKDFDILGICLPYELSYMNILTILSAAGIPWRAKDRDDSYPLVIGGGPCAFNPEPVADFFDAIVIGDGERALIEIMEAVKDKRIDRLSEIEGVYVPSQGGKKIKKALVEDIEVASYPEKTVVPYAAVHDRVGIEVGRGCTRGCRFCQAGFIYRPTRFRSPETATRLAINQLQNSGHEDISFLSLSLGDYPCLNELLRSVNDSWNGAPINSQFPSLRVESLSDETLSLLGKARHGSFTLAPEAATERMRLAINKGNTDEDLYASAEKIFKAGWHQIKLYFMIGLPNETPEELDGIVNMANRCLDIGKKYHHRAEVTVSTSTFIPKSHTPLQWAGQISIEEILEKQAYLKRRLRRHGLFYRWHDAKMSFLEGVFSRGDRRLSYVIEEAHRLGARFDAWDEKFDFSIWQKAFGNAEIDPNGYLKPRDCNTKFPWDNLYTNLKKEFLWREYEKSLSGIPTPDCTREKCQGCGVCNDSRLSGQGGQGAGVLCGITARKRASALGGRSTISIDAAVSEMPPAPPAPTPTVHIKRRIRLTKTGPAALLGHLEFSNVIRRALRRAGLPLCYSEGFHPHAKISFGKALPVGIESECEFCDVELLEPVGPDEIHRRLYGAFPEGVSIVSVVELETGSQSIERSISRTTYNIEGAAGVCDMRGIEEAILRFNSSNSSTFVRRRGDKSANIDLKDFISELVIESEGVIGLTLNERELMIRVGEVLTEIFGLSEDAFYKIRIKKRNVFLKNE